MTAVLITRRPGLKLGDEWVVTFSYDEEVVKLLKQFIPSFVRSWNAEKKEWVVSEKGYVDAFAALLKDQGHTVRRVDGTRAGGSSGGGAGAGGGGYSQGTYGQYGQYGPGSSRGYSSSNSSGYTPPPRGNTIGAWAEEMLRKVSEDQRDATFRALTKVFHPDNPKTGNKQLQQELNDARERVL